MFSSSLLRSLRPFRRYVGRQYSVVPLNRQSKVTINTIQKHFVNRTPISVLTAHDYPSAQAADAVGIDIVLVGDSLAMVACGYSDTTQLGLDEMLYHCKAVKRGTKHAYLVGDLPFGSYEVSSEQAMATSIRMIKEGGMEAVKLEGGIEMAETVRRITRSGIAVMGHIGLLPQRQASLGGFKVQGKTAARAKQLLDDALALQDAGVMSMVVEAVPPQIAEYITSRLSVPTISIGAGPGCSGQVLVQMDLLGVFDRFITKFCKQYDQIGQRTREAIAEYNKEVKAGTFPTMQHTYPMSDLELEEWKKSTAS